MPFKRFATDSNKLRSYFPMLVPLDSSGLSYDGFISVFGQEYRLKIKLPENKRLADAQIEGDLTMAGLLEDEILVLKQRLAESSDLPSFLLELAALLESRLRKVHSIMTSGFRTPNYYLKLQSDFNALGWERIAYVDGDLSEVHIRVLDVRNREHLLMLKLSAEYPAAAPKVNCDLPTTFKFNFEEGNGLLDIVMQFEKLLTLYQKLWNELDDVDANTWVQEPEKPRRSDVTRRLALGGGATLIFTVDPLVPCAPPQWQMLGSEKVVRPLQATLDETFNSWDETNSLLENWKKVLRMELPSPRNTKKEDVQKDCGICYVFKLGDKIPDRTCEDVKCRREYHSDCLSQWLHALPNNRQTYNTIFGECPYCSKPISCQI